MLHSLHMLVILCTMGVFPKSKKPRNDHLETTKYKVCELLQVSIAVFKGARFQKSNQTGSAL